MIKKGEKVVVLRDDTHPLKTPNTRLVAFLRTLERAQNTGKVVEEYLDTVTETGAGETRRTVVYILNNVVFSFLAADGSDEKLSVADIKRLWSDKEWCKANPMHPISLDRECNDEKDVMRNAIKNSPPHIQIQRGTRHAYISPTDSEEKKKTLMDIFYGR
jgi:hypothetical protein